MALSGCLFVRSPPPVEFPALPPLDPLPRPQYVTCEGYTACFDAANAKALADRLSLLVGQRDFCREQYDRERAIWTAH